MQEPAHDLQQSILQQVEFYFSPANLLTDEHLSRAIKRSSNSWLPISYLLGCARIKATLAHHNVKLRERRRVVAKILRQSSVVKLDNFRVKRVKRISLKQERTKMVYVEVEG